MKPPRFLYHRPDSLDEALELLAQHGGDTSILAGGQSLMPLLNLRIVRPGHIVDINRIPELAGLTANGSLQIGAMVRQHVMLSSETLRRWPLLGAALRLVGHAETRNRGTIVGSLAHADPVAELPTVALALDAEIVLARQGGERSLAAGEFFTAPFMTAREPDEIVREVSFPAWPEGAGSSFQEVAPRHNDLALVGVAAVVRLGAGEEIAEARLAYAGADATPVRAHEAETQLVGASPGEDAFAAAATLAAEGLQPPSDVLASADYRRHVARELTVVALREASARAKGGG